MVETADEANELSKKLGFPLLVRPSYVLGGQRMKIVINEDELERHVIDIFRDMPDNKVLLDHYLDGAIECEADAICDGDECASLASCSTSSSLAFTAATVMQSYRHNLGDLIISQIEEYTKRIALALETVGLINIQFAVKDDQVYIIEETHVPHERCRSSRKPTASRT